MKKAISLILSLLMIVGIFAGLPSVSAEEIELPPEVPEESEDFVRQMMESYGCTPVPGGEIHTSTLESGKSYCFLDDVELILDAAYTCTAVAGCGNITIRGSETLTAGLVYANRCLRMESGTVICPVMENPYVDGTRIYNGLLAKGSVYEEGSPCIVVEGGSVTCPVILSLTEAQIQISGGAVKADRIHALYGARQSGGTVEVGEISAREGFSISGGSLRAGTVSSAMVWFKGGVSEIDCLVGINGPDDTSFSVTCCFPMIVTAPEGVTCRNYSFRDQEGNLVTKNLRIEQVEVDCPFTDVSENSYCYTPMLWAYYYGVTTGTDETHFSPNSTCTRGQIVTFLWRASGSPEPERTDCPFTDLDLNASYYKAVLWAVEKGVTTGKTDTIFAPKDPCSRAQIVTFLWRSQGSPKPKGWYGEPRFTDVPKKSFYYQALCWAWEEGIAAGTSEKRFSPYRPCTRGQAVTFLMRTFG